MYAPVVKYCGPCEAMTGNSHITCFPLPDVVPKAELNALARIYALVLQKYRVKHKVVTLGDSNEVTKGVKNDRVTASISRLG